MNQAEETLLPSSLAATTPTQGAQDPDLAICPASQGPPPSSDTDTFPLKVTGVGAEISEKQPTGAGLLVSAAESHISSTQPTVWEDALQGSVPASWPGAPGHAPCAAHSWFAVDSEEAFEDPVVSPASFPFKREGRG